MNNNAMGSLNTRAERIKKYQKRGLELTSQIKEVRIKIGRELREASREIKTGTTNLSPEAWYKQNVNLPNHSIYRFMALARNANPVHAREKERSRRSSEDTVAKGPVLARGGESGRQPAEKHPKLRQALLQISSEGAKAFNYGVPQCDCPYIEPLEYSAWRTGWYDAEERVKHGRASGWRSR